MLKYRLITGTLLVAALCIIVFVPGIVADLLFLLVAITVIDISLREYFGMTARLDAPGYSRLCRLAALTMLATATPLVQQAGRGYPIHLLACIGFLFAGFILLFRETDFQQGLRNFMATTAGFAYLGWTIPCLALVYYHNHPRATGPHLLLFIILVTKCGDIGGYTLGNITARIGNGNHKMVPRLSPKKSWEGLAGSILFSAGAGWLLAAWLDPQLADGTHLLPPGIAAVLGALLAVVGLIGDLAESVLKRASGVKDWGRILPGMGGLLDVVDSLVFAGPLFYCYMRWISGVS